MEIDDQENEVPRPAKPIFALNTEDMSSYFGEFLKHLYKVEHIDKFKLWATKDKDGNVLKEPTPLKIYYKKAEEILERHRFIGRGSGGANIGNKLKVVTAYLLEKMGIDHNEHCERVPDDYNSVKINYNDFSDILNVRKAK